ncbi:transcription factor S-II [Angelfish iridovirus AFIV-16]|nr:transcription factor S-II [Angelfish iridovirus AFIV-16]
MYTCTTMNKDLYDKEAEQDQLARTRFSSLTQSQYLCRACGNAKTYTLTMQTRGGDEALSVFVCCVACGKRYRI